MWIEEVVRRLRTLGRSETFNRDLEDEMRLHVQLREQSGRDQGMSGDEAHAAALRSFGNEALLREVSREAWGWTWLEQLAQDVRYGVRTMLRTPGFTAVAVIALALGIGANTAIFSVVNAVLLRPLAYRDSDQLVVLLHGGNGPVAVANFLDWRKQAQSFTGMEAADYWTPNLANMDPPEHLWALKVTAGMFPLLGVEPMLGRTLSPDADQPGRPLEVVLSYRLWQRRFSGDRGVLGKTVTLDGNVHTIVGVMPPDFRFAPFWATRAELWAPVVLAPRAQQRGGNSLRVFARLKPGVSLDQARAEMATITARLDKEFPGSNRDLQVRSLKDRVVGDVRPALLVLLGSVGFVLLIACANVAHMLLARSASRQREIAVRAALGARRGRMIRQFMTESLLLAAAGAASGLLLSVWGTRALVALGGSEIPRIETIGVDARVVLFLLGVTVLTGVLFGLAPALHATVMNLSEALKEGGRGGSDSARRSRLRGFLVASEFALALMLLVGAGLMIRSFMALEAIDPGFNPQHVVSMVVPVTGSAEAPPEKRVIFYRALLDKVRALPGVEAAGGVNHLPLVGDIWGWVFRFEGRPEPGANETPFSIYRAAAPGYFQAMGIPLLRGRDIAYTDDAKAPGVVVVNEEFVRRYFRAGEDPLGKRITFDWNNQTYKFDTPTPEWLTIIGVVKDAKQGDWADRVQPETYIAFLQSKLYTEDSGAHAAYITLVARTAGDPGSLVPAMKEAVASLDRNLPVADVTTMQEAVKLANAQPRFETLLLLLFAAVALTLAAVGIYGVMSYAVTQRTQEIGIRMSLGARQSDILRMVVRQGMTLALVGGALGLAAALVVSRFMEKMLYGVKPRDPATFAAVALVLGLVALAATYIPGRRATRIDPMAALRHE